jgi:hypothetical protein
MDRPNVKTIVYNASQTRVTVTFEDDTLLELNSISDFNYYYNAMIAVNGEENVSIGFTQSGNVLQTITVSHA